MLMAFLTEFQRLGPLPCNSGLQIWRRFRRMTCIWHTHCDFTAMMLDLISTALAQRKSLMKHSDLCVNVLTAAALGVLIALTSKVGLSYIF